MNGRCVYYCVCVFTGEREGFQGKSLMMLFQLVAAAAVLPCHAVACENNTRNCNIVNCWAAWALALPCSDAVVSATGSLEGHPHPAYNKSC